MAQTITDDIDFRAFLKQQQSQFVRPASSWRDEVNERILLGRKQYGARMPWHNTHDHLRFRPGEVTLWAGINKHGKSLVAAQTILWLIIDVRALIASMEMPPASTIERLIRQASGSQEPTLRFSNDWQTWTDDRLWIYDQSGTVDAESIHGMMYYAAEELACEHILIDSLLKCGYATDDYTGQKDFVDGLCQIAKNASIHIHLVHHMRKGRKESDRPDKFDIRGAGEIADLVDNILIVHRNKDKEEKIRTGKEVNAFEPDTTITVAGQRHGTGWEGRIALWYDEPSQQLMGSPNRGPMRWPGFDE